MVETDHGVLRDPYRQSVHSENGFNILLELRNRSCNVEVITKVMQSDEVKGQFLRRDITHEFVEPIAWDKRGIEGCGRADFEPGFDKTRVEVDCTSDREVIDVGFGEAEDVGVF